MGNIQEIDITSLHTSIEDAINGSGLGFVTVQSYTRIQKKLATPAFIYELTMIEPSENPDMGTEQTQVDLHFTAYIYMGYNLDAEKIACRILAAKTLHFINANRWQEPVCPAEIKTCEDDSFDPEYNGSEVWRIEWINQAYLGNSIFEESENVPTPSIINIGYSPDINDIDNYDQL